MKRLLSISIVLFALPAAASPSLSELRAQIRVGALQRPTVTQAVAAIRDRVIAAPPPVGRGFQVSRQLQQLGPEAALPLLQLVDGPGPAGAPPRTAALLKLAALDALTHLKEPRGTALYEKLFDEDGDADVARAAGEALGALESGEAMTFLLDRALAGHPREKAAFAGLAFCRKGEVAHRFAARLSERPEPKLVRVLAQRAAFWGSSWAWEALGPERAAEGLAARQALAESLLAALPAYEGDARTAIENALVTIEHPMTKDAIARLRPTAPSSLVKHLDQLAARLK